MYQVIKDLVKEKDLIAFFENITPSPDQEDDVALYLERRIWVYVFGHTQIKPKTILEKINILSHQKQNYMTGLESFYAESVAEGISIGEQKGEARGISLGKAEGKAEGILLTTKIIKLHTRGFGVAAIAEKLETEIEIVHIAIAEYEAE
jgi:predicted transposase YdaD